MSAGVIGTASCSHPAWEPAAGGAGPGAWARALRRALAARRRLAFAGLVAAVIVCCGDSAAELPLASFERRGLQRHYALEPGVPAVVEVGCIVPVARALLNPHFDPSSLTVEPSPGGDPLPPGMQLLSVEVEHRRYPAWTIADQRRVFQSAAAGLTEEELGARALPAVRRAGVESRAQRRTVDRFLLRVRLRMEWDGRPGGDRPLTPTLTTFPLLLAQLELGIQARDERLLVSSPWGALCRDPTGRGLWTTPS